MHRIIKNFKTSLVETLSPNPENYAYWQSFFVGTAVVYCKFLVDTLILDKEKCEEPIITFTLSVYFSLYYFVSNDVTVSFKNYKINYNHSLGEGAFGQVYALVPRPENEKGYLSNLFPYIYDYYFPLTDTFLDVRKYGNTGDCEKYCVKIYTPSKRFVEKIRDHVDDMQSNKVLINHGMTNVKLYSSNCLFSQIKTRIHGKTLCWHQDNNSFIDPENYIMRERFVLFYRSLSASNMLFQDVHSNNIMYDERKNQWEIIDGVVRDSRLNENISYKFFSRFTRLLDDSNDYPPENFDSVMLNLFQNNENNVFMLLREAALSSLEYSKEKDAEILGKCVKQTFFLSEK